MKIHQPLIALAVATLAIASSNTAIAESTYGYNAAGTGVVTATAKVTTTVAVPKLILLRVGSDASTVDTVTLNASFSSGIPGGVAALTNGNSQASAWNKTAPVTTVAAAAPVLASSWTNSTGGGQLTCTISTTFGASSGLTSADISVGNTAPLAGGSLVHPGGTTACSGSTSFAKNAVVGSSWTYTLTSTNASAGSYTQTVTYTATSL